jgi:hypothetical protein
MNHQPFRDWLLTDEKLSADQVHELQVHINSCASCKQIGSAWQEVESTLHKAPQVQPEPGFINRWQAHLAEYIERKQKRRGWMMIGLTSIIIIALLGIVSNQLWSLLQTPGPFLVVWFTRILSLVTIYYTLQDLLSSFTGSISLITLTAVFFLVGFASFMSVLWLATYRKLSYARRIL